MTDVPERLLYALSYAVPAAVLTVAAVWRWRTIDPTKMASKDTIGGWFKGGVPWTIQGLLGSYILWTLRGRARG